MTAIATAVHERLLGLNRRDVPQPLERLQCRQERRGEGAHHGGRRKESDRKPRLPVVPEERRDEDGGGNGCDPECGTKEQDEAGHAPEAPRFRAASRTR